jgi:hypothetical protein
MQAINFTISVTTRGINYDFGLEQILYSIRFSNIFASFNKAVEEIYQIFVQMVITFTNNMKKNYKIRIVFFNESILTCTDLPFVLRDDFTASLIMNAFDAVMQSYQIQYLNIKDILKANVQKQTIPFGSGRTGQGGKKKQKQYTPSIKINNNILTQLKDNSI